MNQEIQATTAEYGKIYAIRARNIGIFYNNKRKVDLLGKHRYWALKDISFDLYKGECLGVLGKNGAGKSTLMRLIAGIHTPDKGEIETFGNSVSLLTIGAGFINYLSGRDNMILSAQLLGLSKKEANERLRKMIRFSGLDGFIDEPVYSYSTGMRARLGFSVAIESDPDVLLIDEVLGVGDKDFKKQSSEKMRKLIKSGKTIVLISHSAETIQELSDRAILIENGKTVCCGEPANVVERYLKGAHK